MSQLVEVQHEGIEAHAFVPARALKQMKKQGWEPVDSAYAVEAKDEPTPGAQDRPPIEGDGRNGEPLDANQNGVMDAVEDPPTAGAPAGDEADKPSEDPTGDAEQANDSPEQPAAGTRKKKVS